MWQPLVLASMVLVKLASPLPATKSRIPQTISTHKIGREKRFIDYFSPSEVTDYEYDAHPISDHDAVYRSRGYQALHDFHPDHIGPVYRSRGYQALRDLHLDHIGPVYVPGLHPDELIHPSDYYNELLVYQPRYAHGLVDMSRIDQNLADTGVALHRRGEINSLVKILTYQKHKINRTLNELKQRKGLSAGNKKEIRTLEKKLQAIEKRIRNVQTQIEKGIDKAKKKSIAEMHDVIERILKERIDEMNSNMKYIDENLSLKRKMRKAKRRLQKKIAERIRLRRLKENIDAKKGYDRAVRYMLNDRKKIVKEKIAYLKMRVKEYDKANKAGRKYLRHPPQGFLDLMSFQPHLDLQMPYSNMAEDRHFRSFLLDKDLDDD